MTVTFEEYMNDKIAFAKKHNKKADCTTYTSPMVNNSYHKEMCWDDGHNFYEATELIEEIIEVEAHGIKTRVPVKFWRTEYWSTEAGSKFFYERA